MGIFDNNFIRVVEWLWLAIAIIVIMMLIGVNVRIASIRKNARKQQVYYASNQPQGHYYPPNQNQGVYVN